MHEQSFTEVSAEFLKNRISCRLHAIRTERKRRWDETVLSVQRERDFWRVIFPWLKPLNYEEAREKFDRDNLYTPNCYGVSTEDTLLNLEKLLIHDKPIFLTAADLSIL